MRYGHNSNDQALPVPNTKHFAVRPVMERESEYNRLNSSHNESENSMLSFQRNRVETMSGDSLSASGRVKGSSYRQNV